jgi:hypothetical protein
MTSVVLVMLTRLFTDAPAAFFYTQKREGCSCILCTDESGFFAIACGVSYSQLGVAGHYRGCFLVYLTLSVSQREHCCFIA